jgi:hypothetical protein
MTLLVTCEPPVNITSPKVISIRLKLNDDLISLSTASVEPESISSSLSRGDDHYLLHLDLPAEYGVFDTAFVTVAGRSYVTSIEVDTCRILELLQSVASGCLSVEYSPSVVTRRQDECGDESLRMVAWPQKHSIIIRKDGNSISVASLHPENAVGVVTITDVLGRVILVKQGLEFPTHLVLSSPITSPILVLVTVNGESTSRLFTP